MLLRGRDYPVRRVRGCERGEGSSIVDHSKSLCFVRKSLKC